MILGRDFFKKIVIIVSITSCFTLAGLPVFAASSQENPDTAAVVFSGVSLFQLYAGRGCHTYRRVFCADMLADFCRSTARKPGHCGSGF